MTRFRIKQLDHVVLRARNAPRLVKFYEQVLGCTLERELDVGLIQLRAGDALIDILPVESKLGRSGGEPPARENSGKNLDHFCLRIDPFLPEQLLTHFRAHHVATRGPLEVYGAEGFGPSIYLKDPEGNTIELKGPGNMPVGD